MENEKPKFETMKSISPLVVGNKVYYISEQKIVQGSGNSSLHLVIKKQPMNDDGSPQGPSKQLYIPIDDALSVLKSALDFISQKK